MTQTMNCPVCEEAGCSQCPWSSETDSNPQWKCNCPRCGQFAVSHSLVSGDLVALLPKQRAVLSHRLRRQQRASSVPPWILQSHLPQVDDPLPNPAEQADNLILWIGEHQPTNAEYTKISAPRVSAWIGAAITPNEPHGELLWLLDQDPVKNFVEAGRIDQFEFRLNMAGWRQYEALKHAQVESRTAFMAMKFGDDELNRVVNDRFKPAVEAAGFELRVLTDGQPAGLIDDQLRVRLRTARFVIADLTHGNRGAYWEAGFAEGLGRPVIYTCRKKEWDERDLPSEHKVHFDTNHHLTVIWDPENLGDAATHLTAIIRNTLPAEAKMTD